MWDSLKNSTDLDLSRVAYTVLALGDSHYWPRKEDKVYYNKPGKDLDARLEALGGKRLVPIGLGDDQDPDGYETGYNFWEPELWKALGADEVDADFEEPKPLTNEDIKINSNFLRGTIAEGLADMSTGAIAESDGQLTKFHGTYMQDDRDLREERKSQGLEPAYSFMVRVRMAAGVCQPEQWIAMDDISGKWGNETFKLVCAQVLQMLTHCRPPGKHSSSMGTFYCSVTLDADTGV
jgi:sulfite reductase (NADPH) hemoprotein beta-component